jgi:hypothetical protein
MEEKRRKVWRGVSKVQPSPILGIPNPVYIFLNSKGRKTENATTE